MAGKTRPRGWWRLALLIGLFLAALILIRFFDLSSQLVAWRNWLKELGPLAPLAFFVIYIIAVLATVPNGALGIAGGVLFGSVAGVVLVSTAATAGAALAFLISRYFLLETTINWLGQNQHYQRLDRLMEEHGAIVVALTRLIPIFPSNFLSYGFGLTSVSFGTFVFWTWLCRLPIIIVYVVGADAITRALAGGDIPWFLLVPFVAALLLLVPMLGFARRKLGSVPRNPSAGDNHYGEEAMVMPEVTPSDEFNRELVENVRPANWPNPEPAPVYNLVVVGAGTAGLVTAAGSAGLGARVALVERHLMGGDCLNYGCVPSKALIRSARLCADIRRAAALGVQVPEGAAADFPAVMARMRRLRAGISQHDSARRFRDLGVDVFLGQAHFTGRNTIDVDGKTLRFRKAVIATGGRAVRPDIPGLAEAGFLTNETVFSLTERPRRLLVMGGGPIGCELAQAMLRLGCQVTLLHKYDRLMNREDPDAAAIVQKIFLREGMTLILNAKPIRVERTGTGTGKTIYYQDDGREEAVEVDEILVGAGRAPNVEGLNLEAAGVNYEAGKGRGVLVNDRLQTSNRNIYAAGDICLPYQFTHMADASARIVIQNALFFGRKKLSALTVPWCTYTDPEVARVGLSEQEAQKRKVPYQVFKKPLREVDRAVIDGEEEGFVKILVSEGSDRLLGATIVASHAGEMISEVTLAMTAKMGLGALAGVIHPYPTQAEAIRAAGDLYNRTRLTPFVKSLFTRFLAWRR
jgi:pyruvate/2-oxoglutarate dehydrogenase complex dihydrolipoamide dehydrogenase (E3) component/uncharacterized membrane protein YdjX (TVP38/TMEM64 family)